MSCKPCKWKTRAGLDAFDPLLQQHLGHLFGNLARLVWFAVGAAAPAPCRRMPRHSAGDGTRINRLSAALACCADVALGVLGGDLKRRELLSARLGDVHSELFIACSILKFHDSGTASAAATLHAGYAVQRSLHGAGRRCWHSWKISPALAGMLPSPGLYAARLQKLQGTG